MKVETWDIGRITPYPGNPRANVNAVAAVAKSISEFGFRQPIVVDKDGVIIVGHSRWKAALELGLATVPVHVASELNPMQAKAYRIADNKTADLSDWDTDRLANELAELALNTVDLEGLGFSHQELEQLLNPNGGFGLTDRDALPKPAEKAVTRTGDLWKLEKHRLLCGDSLNADDVARVTCGPMPLAITDPPFDMDACEQARALRLAGVKTAIVFGGGSEIFRLANLDDYRLRFDFVIVYDRAVCLTGKTSLIYRHNRIVLMDEAPGFDTGCVLGKGVPFDRDKYASITGTKCSVLQAPVQKQLYGYGKCCDVFRAFVRAMDCPMVYDPFAGSGTSLVACEIEGKTWVGMEVKPGVADIAVKRWEAFTGRKAVRE